MDKTGEITRSNRLVCYCVQNSDSVQADMRLYRLIARIIICNLVPELVDGAMNKDCVEGGVVIVVIWMILLNASDHFMRVHLLVILVYIVQKGSIGARARKLVIAPNQLHNLIVCYTGLHSTD